MASSAVGDPNDALLNSSRIVDSCRAVAAFATKVLDGQEDVLAFHKFLPRLLSTTMGTDTKRGWLQATRTQAEGRALLDLLSTRGPLFRAVIALSSDQRLMYELPFSKLTSTAQKLISSGDLTALSPLYSQRLFVDSVASGTAVQQADYKLKLNVVEYFLYCFVFSIATFREQSATDWQSAQTSTQWTKITTLLPTVGGAGKTNQPIGSASVGPVTMQRDVLLDYLNFLLPFPDHASGHAAAAAGSSNSVVAPVPQYASAGSGQSPPSTPATPTASRTIPGSLTPSTPAAGAARAPQPGPATSATPQPVQGPKNIFLVRELGLGPSHMDVALRISEFFVRVIGELWMTQNRYELDPVTRRPTTLYGYVPVPTEILRYSTAVGNHLGGFNVFGPEAARQSEEALAAVAARKMAWQATRRSAYRLVQLGMTFGSADTNFEATVDTWLSFLRPWASSNGGAKFTSDWTPFVLDSFLLYVMPLSVFVARMSRIDATESPLNVAVMERVTRAIMGDADLLRVLHTIESSLQSAMEMPVSTRTFATRSFSAGMPITPVADNQHQLTPAQLETVRNHMRAMEGPVFEWQAVLLAAQSDAVAALHRFLGNAINRSKQVAAPAARNGGSSVIPAFMKSSSSSSAGPAPSPARPQSSPVDTLRAIEVRLQQGFPKIPGATLDDADIRLQPRPDDERVMTPEMEMNVHGPVLTSAGREQVKRGLRKCTNLDVPVRGAPGDHLVKSYESEHLVKLTTVASDVLTDRWAMLVRYLREQRHWNVPQQWQYVRINLRPLAAPRNILFVFACLFMLWFGFRVLLLIARLIWRRK